MKKVSIKKLIEEIEGKLSLSDKFHEITNNRRLDKIEIENVPESWIKIHFKTYPRFDKVLLSPKIPVNSHLSNILIKRRSVRQFNGRSISKKELSYILFNSSGLINLGKTLDNSRRPYPSAGARYPLEVYPLIQNCNAIKKGLYHYNVKENCLELLLEKDLSKWLIKTTGGEKWITNTAIVFIITGVLDRTRIKYKDRGYRYILIEAGHLGQNISLLATELGLGSCALGGYIDNEVNKLLDIQFQKETTLYLIAVGKT